MKALALVVVLGFAACAPSPSPSSPPPPVAKQSPAPASPPPTLAAAIRHAARLGPSDATTTVSLSFALKIRNPERLAALIASGKTVSPEAYAAEFGIDPTQVQGAVAELQRTGFKASWRPGSSLIAADGPAPLAAGLLQVDIESYRLADGTTFYAT